MTWLEPVATHGPRMDMRTGAAVPCVDRREPHVPADVPGCVTGRADYVQHHRAPTPWESFTIAPTQGRRTRRRRPVEAKDFHAGAASLGTFTRTDLRTAMRCSQNTMMQWVRDAIEFGSVVRIAVGRYRYVGKVAA